MLDSADGMPVADLTATGPAVVALRPKDLGEVGEELAACHAHFAPLFAGREQREWADVYLRGLLLADVLRKNVEAMALRLLGAGPDSARPGARAAVPLAAQRCAWPVAGSRHVHTGQPASCSTSSRRKIGSDPGTAWIRETGEGSAVALVAGPTCSASSSPAAVGKHDPTVVVRPIGGAPGDVCAIAVSWLPPQ
jgi:hypothetical protein